MFSHDENKIEELIESISDHNELICYGKYRRFPIKNIIKQYAEQMVQQERERMANDIEKIKHREHYNGNSLEEAKKVYSRGFIDMMEVVRFEDGQESMKHKIINLINTYSDE